MLVNMTVNEFAEELASDSPAPGGGSVAAVSGTLGAGLVSMVCRLTIGKKKYEAVEELMTQTLSEVETHRQALGRLVDEDTDAFNQVMAGFKLPRDTDEQKAERGRAIQLAFKQAADVPFSVCRHCVAVLKLIDAIAGKANANALSDLGVAGEAAMTGLRGAAMNVRINLPAITDTDYTAEKNQQVRQLLDDAAMIKSRIDRIIEDGL